MILGSSPGHSKLLPKSIIMNDYVESLKTIRLGRSKGGQTYKDPQW